MAENEVISIAKTFADKVRSIMDTKAIFLYGSYAKGTATDNSDIDIAVIVDTIPGDYLSTVSKLWGITRTVHEDIEPVLLTASDYDTGFLQTVYNTGIAV